MVVVSVAGSSSVASFANSSDLSFPSISMCPGTHETSTFAPRVSSRNDIAASVNRCDICWLRGVRNYYVHHCCTFHRERTTL